MISTFLQSIPHFSEMHSNNSVSCLRFEILNFTLKIYAVYSPVTLVTTYRASLCQNPEYHNQQFEKWPDSCDKIRIV